MPENPTPTLSISRTGGVVDVTLENPPVNALSAQMMRELHDLLEQLREDDDARVIVFRSADPDFFIAHVDMRIGEDLETLGALQARGPADVNVFQGIGELLRHQPQVSIVVLEGIARGGGAEFVAAADMAFASLERAGLGQIEALMGIIPGGGGTQYLAERVGRPRALEIVLGAELMDARTAAAYGWVNRALPDAELRPFVDRLARQIAALPDGVIAATKAAIAPAELGPGLTRENAGWADLVGRPAAARLMGAGLERGAQTPEGELRLEALLRELG